MARKLSLLDAGWLMMETRETPMHVAGLQLFEIPDGAPDDYLEQVYHYLLDVPGAGRPFNQKLVSRFPGNLDARWEDDTAFDVHYHVRHSALPKPGRIRELLALVSRLHAHRLDRSRPLWECHLIEGVEGNRFGLYMKMHHAMIDGVGGARLLATRISSVADQQVPPPWSSFWDTQRPHKPKPLVQRAQATVGDSVRSFSRGAGQLAEMLRLPLEGNAKTLYRAPKTFFNQPVTGARRFAAQSWPLQRIKAVGQHLDATVNDIFLALCGGALRSYLLQHEGLPAQPLVAQIPIALRSADEADDGGNAITAVQVTLGTDHEHALDRLRAIQDSMSAVKTRLGAMKKDEINAFTALSNLPLSVGQMTGVSGRVKPMFNLVISNVPGPRQPLYLMGAKLQANYPVSLIWHGYALNITVTSYCDSLDVGIIACRDTVPRVQRMLDFFEQALCDLEAITPSAP